MSGYYFPMIQAQKSFLVFSDLDGTLLDYSTYSKEEALPALQRLDELGVPLIIVSSKTRFEIEPLLDLPNMSRTFITENGSAIFFHQEIHIQTGRPQHTCGSYTLIRLGMAYSDVLKALDDAQRETGIRVRGFSDMSPEEIADITGLDPESAVRARHREFSEPFLFSGSSDELRILISSLEYNGLTCTQGGRFWHAHGRCDKGMAARETLKIFTDTFPGTAWTTVGLGDSPNDIPLLETVDIAVVIMRHDGSYMDYAASAHQKLILSPGIGPDGWNRVLLHLLKTD
ncbi:MAG: HAD-IIB family hydrolase [Desulfomonilia bacterium]